MYEDRVKWIEHKGKRILKLDYSNLDFDKIIEMVMEEALDWAASL